ncbi:protein OSCP1-like [Lytechinus variegatus]|uniref:protein OSCP1-like n=1 Tax=Lytechinus variegatus TaxID=7654 RepID=UPI001BB21DCC|nr:protein OSCP1-like [Lytechinus variegatus]
MSQRALPVLFINLGGEMLYILDQRLRAQNIPADKARKVMHDIVKTMFNQRFVVELFKPQDIYSKKAMRTVFDRLAHASIMRLNTASMDKLYDLMTMAVKYQISLCLRPKDILLVTLNHMDAIRSFVCDNPTLKAGVEGVCRLLLKTFSGVTLGEFQLIRQTLLGFFQDMHIRVSIFLKEKVQSSNGRFVHSLGGAVPYGTEIPGTIRYFNRDGKQVETEEFSCPGKYIASFKEGSFEMEGDRVIKLGRNMYCTSKTGDATVMGDSGGRGKSKASAEHASANPNPMVKAELNLLAHLMGAVEKKPAGPGKENDFRISMFNTDEEEEKFAAARPPPDMYDFKVINIDASKIQTSEELSRIMGDMAIPDATGPSNKGDDLLELMDSAS